MARAGLPARLYYFIERSATPFLDETSRPEGACRAASRCACRRPPQADGKRPAANDTLEAVGLPELRGKDRFHNFKRPAKANSEIARICRWCERPAFFSARRAGRARFAKAGENPSVSRGARPRRRPGRETTGSEMR